jgi:crossover junction endodeoxyribonuclease RuvC
MGMRILGIDPSLSATGYGFIDFDGRRIGSIKLLEAGTIEPKKSDLFKNRIQKIHKYLDEMVVQYKPDIMVLEKLYAHYKHPVTACKLGHVRGAICLISAQRNIKLIEHSVKRIRVAIVGNGAATKQQTQSVVANILRIDEKKLTIDASDALALALGYVYMWCRAV